MRRLSFLPVLALAALVAAIHLAVDPSVFYDPAWLILVGNALFLTGVSLVVSYVASRNYAATGRIQILLLGCGVLIFGVGGVLAAVVRSLPGGANLNVTIYNTGALFGAALHSVAAFFLLAGVSPEVGSRRRGSWLLLGYGGSVLFMLLLTAACLRGLVPPFFIQGVGPTVLRQQVLGAADVLFLFSFLIFIGTYLRTRGEAFLYWYACALALTAISLTAFFIQRSVGSPVGWVGRLSQYVGGVYFLVSLAVAARTAESRGTSSDDVWAASLSGAEEKFRALAENAPDVIRRFDRELKHIYVNAAGQRLHGRRAGGIVGKRMEEVGLAEEGERWSERILRVFQTGEPTQVEEYLTGEAGRRFYQSQCVPEHGVDGKVANVLVLSRDLTERKRAEEALQRSETKYRNLFQNMTEEVHFWALVRDAEGRIETWRLVDANPPALGTWGRALDEIKGKTADEIFGPGATAHYLPVVQKIMVEGAPHSFEDYFPNLDRYFRFTSIPLGDHFITTGADITVLKKALRQAEEGRAQSEAANVQLEEADRRKSEFLAMLSHELRNPLAPLRNSLYLLDRARAGSPQAARAREVLARQLDHLTRLVDDLLDITRISHGKIELRRARVDARDVVQRTCTDHGALFEQRGIDFHVEIPGGSLWIDADPTRISQALRNLLINAAKFTSEGGKVLVEASRAASQVEISVRDDGVGMEPGVLGRVFEPFVQAERGPGQARGGLGLGLALVKGLVEAHGGTVRAESGGANRGSRLVMSLPLAPAPELRQEVRSAGATARPLEVLVIEDNVDGAETLAAVLELNGHRAHVATDGLLGLRKARELKPDVILCDIDLPGLDGYEIARRLRAEGRLTSTRLVALSGFATPGDRQLALDAGFSAHLAKPVSVEALNALLASSA